VGGGGSGDAGLSRFFLLRRYNMSIGKGLAVIGLSAVAIAAMFFGHLKIAVFTLVVVWITAALD